ncbi:putative ribonuclease H-like domain-containing protein [Tanacetum coccineum]
MLSFKVRLKRSSKSLVYVDDIIFGSTKKELCTEFEKLMHDKFQMSSMGELTFFLGLQVKQKEDGIFISQDKYVAKILRKFSFTDVKTVSTLMVTKKILLKDSYGDDVDVHLYRYLKGQPKLGLWYPRDSSFDLVAYSDSDYAGASLDRKSTIGAEYVAAASCCGQVLRIQNQILDYGYALTENPTIYVSLIQQFWETATARTLDNGEIKITATIDGKVKIVTEASVRRHLKLEDSYGISSLPTTEIIEQLSLMGNMKRASKGYTGVDIPLFPTMIVQGLVVQGKGSTHPESVVPQPRSPTQTPVADEATSTCVDVRNGGATTTVTGLEAGQGNELMVLCTMLSKKVESLKTDLKQTKQIYGASYTKLIKKVKSLEKIVKSSQTRRRTRIIISNDEEDLEDSSKQGRKIAKIDQDPDISLVQDDAVSGEAYRLTREKAKKEKEANVALIETWDDIQAKIDVDHQLAKRMQEQEQEQEELSNVEGYKLNDLKSKGFDSIQEMFDRAFKRVNTFEDFRTEVVEGKEKRAGTELT